jgi:hypothetical protein
MNLSAIRLRPFLALLLALCGLLLLAISISNSLLVWLIALDRASGQGSGPTDPNVWARFLQIYAVAFLVVAAVVAFMGAQVNRLWRSEVVIASAWTLICTGLLLWYLSRLSYDAPWYPIGSFINTTANDLDVFSRRLLFVWPARVLRHLLPSVSDLRIYWMIQAPIIFAMMILIRFWSRLFISADKAFWGQIIAVTLIAPTFSYYTFYDLAIVMFYTAALIALWKRSYTPFVLLVGIGSLNHENTLLLIFVAACIGYGREPTRKLLLALGAALVAWLIARVTISVLIPLRATVHYHVLSNLWESVHEPGAMAFTAMAWLPFILLSVVGWRTAPVPLKRAAVGLIIPLAGVTYVFGKIREPRLLLAYVPLAVAFAMSQLARHDETNRRPSANPSLVGVVEA